MILKKLPESPEQTCYVSPNYSNDIFTRKFSTIQAAIDYAVSQSPDENNMWIVIVENGIYNEQVTMAEYVALKGRNKEICIVERGTLPLVYNVNNTVINTITFRVTDADGKFASIDGGGSQIEIQIYDCFLQGTGDDRNVLELANNVKTYLYETEGDNCGSGDIGKKIITSLASGSNIELYLEAAYICGGITWGGGNLHIFNVELIDDGILEVNGGNVRLDYLWIENQSTYAIKFSTTGSILGKNCILTSGGVEDTIQLTAVPSSLEISSSTIHSSGLYSISSIIPITGASIIANYLEKGLYNIKTTQINEYNVAKLVAGDSESFTHESDVDFMRLVQISRYGSANDSSLDYDEVDEGLFTQEDAAKTDFVGGQVQLSGIGICYAHWMLNESSGTNASDSSGNGRNGTLINMENLDWVPGKLHNCLLFDGVNEYIDCGNIASFERTQPFSLECWFQTSAINIYFMSKFTSALVGYAITINASGQINFSLYSSLNNIQRITTSAYNNGVFHHVIVTYDGSSNVSGMKIYVDNVLVSTTTVGTAITGTLLNATNFRIATREGIAYPMNGLLDEIVIYDRVLSVSDVALRWNSGTGTESVGYDTTKGWYVRTNTNQINTSTWFGIGGITITQTTPTSTNIKYLLSVDGRTTWKKWNGVAWVSVLLANIDTEGNTKSEIEAIINGQWVLLFIAGTLDIVSSLKTTDVAVTPSLSQITIIYLLACRHLCYDADLLVEFEDATTTKITNTTNPPEILYGLKVNIFIWRGSF